MDMSMHCNDDITISGNDGDNHNNTDYANNKPFIILILIAAIISFAYLAVLLNDKSTVIITSGKEKGILGQIIEGDEYIQKVSCNNDDLEKIQIFFGLYNRVNYSTLTVTLSGDEKPIQRWNMTIENAFIVLWVALGAIFLMSGTLFSVPDEINHFYRAFEISDGYLVSDYNYDIACGGRKLPLDVDLSLLKQSWASFTANKDLPLTHDYVFCGFINTALYSPFSY